MPEEEGRFPSSPVPRHLAMAAIEVLQRAAVLFARCSTQLERISSSVSYSLTPSKETATSRLGSGARISQSSDHPLLLRHNNCVARFELNVLIYVISPNHVVIIKVVTRLFGSFLTKNVDLFPFGEVFQSTGFGYDLQNRCRTINLECAFPHHLTDQVHLAAVDLVYRNRDLGNGNKWLQLFCKNGLQLQRGHADDLEFAHQRHRDLSIRTHDNAS